MTDQPIACTLTADQVPDRVALIDALTSDALLGRQPVDGGVRWRFRDGPDVEQRVRELVALESRCCGFLRFDIGRDDSALTVDITGSADAQPVIEQLFAAQPA